MVLASILFHSYASIVTVVNISSCRFGSPKLTRFQYAPPGDGSPERHQPPRGRATASRAPYMTAQRVIGGRTSPNAKLGERGAPRGALPRTSCSVPGKAVDPRGRRGFHHFLRCFLSGLFFVSPALGFHCMEGVLPGMEHYHPPRGYFRIPEYFG